MILNDYRAMDFVRAHSNAPLSPEAVLEPHRIVTEDPLDDPTAAGRLRAIWDFADREDENEDHLHPVVRSTIVHC
jgi:hypothetical protein